MKNNDYNKGFLGGLKFCKALLMFNYDDNKPFVDIITKQIKDLEVINESN